MEFGLQLYSIRNEFDRDWKGALRYVRECGYKFIELFDYLKLPADQLKEECEHLGLEVIGAHTERSLLETRLGEVVEYCRTVGTKYVVFRFAKIGSQEEADELIAFLNETGKKLSGFGINLLYHNHISELNPVGGQTFLEYMMEHTSADYVNFECDVFFVAMRGLDPKAFIAKHSERVPLVHLKDYIPDYNASVAEIGKGDIDFKPLIGTCVEHGITKFIVEQEYFSSSCLQSIKESIGYLNKITG